MEEAKPVELSEEQKQAIVNEWNTRPTNPPSILELIKKIFPLVEVPDARAREGRLIKQFLASRELKAPSPYEKKAPVVLTEEQKLYIKNHYSVIRPLKIAQDLFNDPAISALDLSFIAVNNFIREHQKENNINNPNNSTVDVQEEEFRPPKTILPAAARVNKYSREAIDVTTLAKNTKLQECLKAMIRFCHTPRFILLMNGFTDNTERTLFESSYIRYIWDKPDLTEEEIDSYLNLCCDIISYNRLLEEVARLKRMRDDTVDDNEGKRISMSIVEMIGKLNTELHDNNTRQTKALENLSGKRSERFKNRIKQNESILQIVDIWREEKERIRLIKFAEERKKVTKEELDKLDSLDDMLAEVYGVNRTSY